MLTGATTSVLCDGLRRKENGEKEKESKEDGWMGGLRVYALCFQPCNTNLVYVDGGHNLPWTVGVRR